QRVQAARRGHRRRGGHPRRGQPAHPVRRGSGERRPEPGERGETARLLLLRGRPTALRPRVHAPGHRIGARGDGLADAPGRRLRARRDRRLRQAGRGPGGLQRRLRRRGGSLTDRSRLTGAVASGPRWGWLAAVPGVVFLLAFALYPLVALVLNATGLGRTGVRENAGLTADHLVRALTSEAVHSAVINSLLVCVSAVVIAIVLSV